MSLKIIAILITAGLVAQSTVFALKTLQNGANTLPGFSYTSEKNANHDKLNITAAEGILNFLPFTMNVTAWSFLQGDGSSTITQETTFPVLGVIYDVQASVGDDSADGRLYAYLGDTAYNVSLTASGDDNQCDLAAKVAKLKTGVELITYGVDKAFIAAGVLEELEAVVWGVLADEVPATLTALAARGLPTEINTDALCKKILAATLENFPEPDL